MIQAIEKYGAKGVLMGTARILRCHPWAEGGDDPVSDVFSLKRNYAEDKERGRDASSIKGATRDSL